MHSAALCSKAQLADQRSELGGGGSQGLTAIRGKSLEHARGRARRCGTVALKHELEADFVTDSIVSQEKK